MHGLGRRGNRRKKRLKKHRGRTPARVSASSKVYNTTSRTVVKTAAPSTVVTFDDVADLAEATLDEENVTALFMRYDNNIRPTLFYTAYAETPSGRVFLQAVHVLSKDEIYENPKHPLPCYRDGKDMRCPYPQEHIIDRAVEYWESRGIDVYEGTVEMKIL